MKTIGLLGGLSWESTAEYYRLINQGVYKQRKGLNSAPIVMQSFNFQQFVDWQNEDRWDKVYDALLSGALGLEGLGAKAIMICTNTMHKFADEIEAELQVPLIHTADAAGEAIAKDGIKTIGLLGTKFTMQGEFYSQRLADKFNVDTKAPDIKSQEIIHKVIYEELSQGEVSQKSRASYLEIMQDMTDDGCEAIVLGCTEIPLLVTDNDTDILLYDTTALHAAKAVSFILDET